MSKLGCVTLINDHDYQIGRNSEGWFAADVECEAGASSDYYGTERELIEAIEKGEANFS